MVDSSGSQIFPYVNGDQIKETRSEKERNCGGIWKKR